MSIRRKYERRLYRPTLQHDPNDPLWRISDRDRSEFNALLPFVVSEIQLALGERWRIVLESRAI